MGFLKKLFGGGNRQPKDSGVYLYFRSKRAADAVTKIRIEPKYDLNQDGDGYAWHKTIVDSRYFSRINAIVRFDSNHQVVSSNLDTGELITAEEYETVLAARNRPADAEESPEDTGAGPE
ncbi:MAG: hypothetical protein ACI85U_001756 [Candidatus Promineifilaceae bacterium]|jgi:hypothetical protein